MFATTATKSGFLNQPASFTRGFPALRRPLRAAAAAPAPELGLSSATATAAAPAGPPAKPLPSAAKTLPLTPGRLPPGASKRWPRSRPRPRPRLRPRPGPLCASLSAALRRRVHQSPILQGPDCFAHAVHGRGMLQGSSAEPGVAGWNSEMAGSGSAVGAHGRPQHSLCLAGGCARALPLPWERARLAQPGAFRSEETAGAPRPR